MQTGAAFGWITLPCVLWSGTLQLFWSAPQPPLRGPLTWIHSALCCLLCHPGQKNTAVRHRGTFNEQKKVDTDFK